MMLKTSYEREIDRFCQKLIGGDYQIREVTKGALSQARAKLNPWAFQRLNTVAVNSFYETEMYDEWYGHRVLAVDGSRLRLPRSKDIKEEFGEYEVGPKADSKVCMATCSIVHDVLNHITISASIGPWSKSELAYVMEDHMEVFEKGDLVLADRYYPCHKLMLTLHHKEVAYCFRMKEDWWLSVKDFRDSKAKDSIVEIEISKQTKRELQLDDSVKKIKCRLLKIELDNGNTEILCTSLLDQELYLYEEFKELYHLRWNVEEVYKLLKSRVEIEQFTGRTSRSIYQDFYAKIFMMTLCAALSYPIAEKVKIEFKAEKTGNMYDQQINRTNAISATKDSLVNLLLKPIKEAFLNTIDKLIEASRVIIKKFRINPRVKKPKKQYYSSYKGI